MTDQPVAVRGNDFANYAEQSLWLWSGLVGKQAVHPMFGLGVIVNVEQRHNYYPLVLVRFTSKSDLSTFSSESFKQGGINLLLDQATADKIAAWVVKRKAADQAKEAAEQKARVEREAAERAKEVAEQQAKAERLRLLQFAQKEFGPLATKYHVNLEKLVDDEGLTPLARILKMVEDREELSQDDITWLEKQRQDRLLATVYFRAFRKTGDGWSLVKTCKYLRKANLPKKALELSNEHLHQTNARLMSALLTTRGGAYRDLRDLESATSSASQAIETKDGSFYPYNLLGAICYEQGNPQEGDKHFEKAIALGSTSRNQDAEIRTAIERATPDTRDSVIDYLLAKDARRYSWAKQYRLYKDKDLGDGRTVGDGSIPL